MNKSRKIMVGSIIFIIVGVLYLMFSDDNQLAEFDSNSTPLPVDKMSCIDICWEELIGTSWEHTSALLVESGFEVVDVTDLITNPNVHFVILNKIDLDNLDKITDADESGFASGTIIAPNNIIKLIDLQFTKLGDFADMQDLNTKTWDMVNPQNILRNYGNPEIVDISMNYLGAGIGIGVVMFWPDERTVVYYIREVYTDYPYPEVIDMCFSMDYIESAYVLLLNPNGTTSFEDELKAYRGITMPEQSAFARMPQINTMEDFTENIFQGQCFELTVN